MGPDLCQADRRTAYPTPDGADVTRPVAVPAAPIEQIAATERIPAARPTVLDQLGGKWGFFWSNVPVVAFAVANAVAGLTLAIAVSVGAAVLITVIRLLRGEAFPTAIGGVLGVAVASGIAAWVGSASGFFLVGIWTALTGTVVTLGSVLVRHPVTGVIWSLVHGRRHAWRDDRPTRRAHDVATLAAAAVFGARFVVTRWLYLADATGRLAVAKVAMGLPLTVLAGLVVFWAFRRSTQRLVTGTGR
ncbi:hypothetical protein Acsp06_52450 [Actinomycetospora sp. NBRC 106375]|uniref:DUF3159 domain-containing protein n=1 Tax=Actinomycetospora sp. NBRC 106375 TaxID=3032207 RepID=UPI0024A3A479|nr:DUF3159 domain-containing protein [Actinomycetospora sp. NBRC 106375]GLZ49060.1 hypothetical protein Acsp06_52450 [Actinomycetospora sp. NBRC 106375]